MLVECRRDSVIGRAIVAATSRGGLHSVAACAGRGHLHQGTGQLCDPLLYRTRLRPLQNNSQSRGLDPKTAAARDALGAPGASVSAVARSGCCSHPNRCRASRGDQ